MKKVFSVFVIAAVVIAMLAVPSFAATITDIDDYGTFGDGVVAGSFDGAKYDGVDYTKDGQPINWDKIFQPDGNYLNGFEWSALCSPIDVTAADCPEVIQISGWLGLDQGIKGYGYKVGDKDPVFKAEFLVEPEECVLDAGGEFVKRFRVDIPAKGADITGTVTVCLVAELDDGTVVAFNSESVPALSFSFELKGAASQGGDAGGGDDIGDDKPATPATGDVSVVIFVVAACAIALVVLKKKVF